MKRLIAVALLLAVVAVLIGVRVAGRDNRATVIESRGVKTIHAPKGYPHVSIGQGFGGDLVTTRTGCVAIRMGDSTAIAVWPRSAKLTTRPTVIHLRGHDYQIDGTPDSQVGGWTLRTSAIRKHWDLNTSACGPGKYVFLE